MLVQTTLTSSYGAGMRDMLLTVPFGSEILFCGYLTGSKTIDRDGESPTQNIVDRFETMWGDPLNTQADREAAAALGHYNEQDPYSNRDPRFLYQCNLQWG